MTGPGETRSAHADASAPPITLSYTLTEAEVEAFYRSVRLVPARTRRALTLLASLLALLFVLYGALRMESAAPGSLDRAEGLLFVLLGPVCLGLLWHGRRSLPRRMVRQMIQRQRQGDLFEPMQATLAPEGLRLETPRMETRWRWNAVREIADGDAAVYIHLSDVQAVIVPHRAFPDDEARRAAVTAAQAWRAAAPFYERACPACGYDLRGTHERRCPECGWTGAAEIADAA